MQIFAITSRILIGALAKSKDCDEAIAVGDCFVTPRFATAEIHREISGRNNREKSKPYQKPDWI